MSPLTPLSPPPLHPGAPNSKLDVSEEKPLKVDGKDAVVSAAGSSLNNYPLVRLDVDVVTDSMAGRLATSLLGHVLFLKNQIPFPVVQLERMPRRENTNTRADKQRTELVAAFDTITSHMDTTFSALSTALSRCPHNKDSKVTRAYLAILVGPSLGSAKSKVVLGIDGLEKRIWGTQIAGDEEQDLVAGAEDSDSAEEPEDSESDESEEEEDSVDEDEDEDDSENVGGVSSSPPLPERSHASEQRFLQNADRLLSRTLAAAEGDGRGLMSEMSPTQTHILIRAPRRFSHPAWIPRQNISTSLDSMLYDFLDHSGVGSASTLSQKKYSKKKHIEGVWITSRAGIQKESIGDAPTSDLLLKQDDDDDMIWWSWEGRLAGFSDW